MLTCGSIQLLDFAFDALKFFWSISLFATKTPFPKLEGKGWILLVPTLKRPNRTGVLAK